jgi:predicted TIM-barrel fold metal-dependent hydrolase
MKSLRTAVCFLTLATAALAAQAQSGPAQWRAEKRLIDLHLHIGYTPERLGLAVKIMDGSGIGVGVNLSGGTTTRQGNQPSEFERNKKLADDLFPGRFVHHMNLDYSRWDEPDFAEQAGRQVEEGHRLGAAGFKQEKTLGLYLRDKNKQLIRVDDPKLDKVWQKCGELGLPVSIHVADPKAFWEPYNDKNERWTELKDHKNWWFGDPNVYPPRMELLEALNRVIARHPKTTFVCVHFANNAEELDWVERALDKYPNMMADLAARVPEIGRHDPAKVRRLLLKHQDRILFATDFQVYAKYTLGSGGSGPAPTDADALDFYAKHWRWLETNDRNFAHMTPIQGDWTISGIGLPNEALRKIYFDNARKLLARSLPKPVARVRHIHPPGAPEETPESLITALEAEWAKAEPIRMEYESLTAAAQVPSATTIRALYSHDDLYLRYDAPFTTLSTFEPPLKTERVGLWDKDVVEAFIGAPEQKESDYYEFEVAPTGERLDLIISPSVPGIVERLAWNGFRASTVSVDHAKKMWTTVMVIPLKSMSPAEPSPDKLWRINFYRIDRAHKAFLAWNPTLTETYHTPARFGWLKFEP